jgi:hypothetical protein
LKEALGLLWEQPSYAQMISYLHQWCAWAMESGVRQMQQLSKTLLGHASGILAWWKHLISNGRWKASTTKSRPCFAKPMASATNAFSFSNFSVSIIQDSHFSDEPKNGSFHPTASTEHQDSPNFAAPGHIPAG